MRLAIGRISDGEVEFAERICRFVRDIYRELTLVVPLLDDSSDMETKMVTMLQSVVKIENGNLMLVFLPKIIMYCIIKDFFIRLMNNLHSYTLFYARNYMCFLFL